MIRIIGLTILISALKIGVLAQTTPEAITLVAGQPAVREISGGESHIYQITLQAGQFARFRITQEWIDVASTLTAPDGKRLFEVDQTAVGEPESFSLEAAVPG